ncbi:hypothetical protein OHA71_22415 [Streptomyces sp. NBC_00444]|uniref:hypothetical protein n=1 Tax=Streptomyces sp. NBC_00444 TaxID=2975744 RepID=UPI002E1E96FB
MREHAIRSADDRPPPPDRERGPSPWEAERVHPLTRCQVGDRLQELGALYAANCGSETWQWDRLSRAFLRRLVLDIRRPGFGLLVAENATMTACAYGFLLHAGLFEIREIVVPGRRGRGGAAAGGAFPPGTCAGTGGRCRRRPGAVRPQWSGSGRGGSGAPPRGRGHLHHTYTNVVGRDRDLGHTILRMSPDQPWHPVHLLQPMYAALLAPVFEWGIALYELPADAVTAARKSVRAFLSDVLDDESRGEWCLRQIQGSANIEGSPDPRTRSFTLVRRDPQAPRVTSELSGCCGPKSTLKRGSHSVSLADRRVSCPTPAPRG